MFPSLDLVILSASNFFFSLYMRIRLYVPQISSSFIHLILVLGVMIAQVNCWSLLAMLIHDDDDENVVQLSLFDINDLI